jgi:hypothetical protein
MTVLCINDRGWVEKRRFLFFWKRWGNSSGPKYGDECVVVGEEGDFYWLDGWPEVEFQKDGFIPLMNDAVEAATEYIQEFSTV